jgi:SWIB/MDM2 domain
MAEFIGRERGTYISRIKAAKYLTNYIRDNSLKDTVNGRIIRADAKLSKLLQITEVDDVHFLNLQKYMKHHGLHDTLHDVVDRLHALVSGEGERKCRTRVTFDDPANDALLAKPDKKEKTLHLNTELRGGNPIIFSANVY